MNNWFLFVCLFHSPTEPWYFVCITWLFAWRSSAENLICCFLNTYFPQLLLIFSSSVFKFGLIFSHLAFFWCSGPQNSLIFIVHAIGGVSYVTLMSFLTFVCSILLPTSSEFNIYSTYSFHCFELALLGSFNLMTFLSVAGLMWKTKKLSYLYFLKFIVNLFLLAAPLHR